MGGRVVVPGGIRVEGKLVFLNLRRELDWVYKPERREPAKRSNRWWVNMSPKENAPRKRLGIWIKDTNHVFILKEFWDTAFILRWERIRDSCWRRDLRSEERRCSLPLSVQPSPRAWKEGGSSAKALSFKNAGWTQPFSIRGKLKKLLTRWEKAFVKDHQARQNNNNYYYLPCIPVLEIVLKFFR